VLGLEILLGLLLGRRTVYLVPIALVVPTPAAISVLAVDVAVMSDIDAIGCIGNRTVGAVESGSSLARRVLVGKPGALRSCDMRAFSPLFSAGGDGTDPLAVGIVSPTGRAVASPRVIRVGYCSAAVPTLHTG
jgi:hypothetical protein